MPEALNAEIMEFIDNGYSGTNFERPQVQKLIELVRANQIDCIIVKDFSRFGRIAVCRCRAMRQSLQAAACPLRRRRVFPAPSSTIR